MATVTIQKRKRGPFGWLIAILFWGFNVLMAVWLFGAFGTTVEQYQSATTEAARAGTAIGATLGVGMILVIWGLGAIILGMMMLFTRGKTVSITEERP